MYRYLLLLLCMQSAYSVRVTEDASGGSRHAAESATAGQPLEAAYAQLEQAVDNLHTTYNWLEAFQSSWLVDEDDKENYLELHQQYLAEFQVVKDLIESINS